MKSIHFKFLACCFSFITVTFFANASESKFSTVDANLHGKQLLKSAEEKLSGWKDELVSGEMHLFDAKGRGVARSFQRIGLEGAYLEGGELNNVRHGDKSIIKFTAPADIKGVSALNYENSGGSDDNWLYMPSTRKVRRISGSNNTASFQGSEFTYEDLNDLDPEEYEWRLIEETTLLMDNETVVVFKIGGTPVYQDTGYSRITVYLSKANHYQTKVEYFDKSGTHLKTRTSSQWKLFHGRFWRALHVDMSNHITGKKTTLSFSNYLVDLSQYISKKTGKPRENLNDSLFTKRALMK
jgi:hypothetical protein